MTDDNSVVAVDLRAEAEAEMAELKAQEGSLRQRIHALQHKLDALITAETEHSPPGHVQNQLAIKSYLEQQKQARATRFARRRAALKNVDPADLQGASQLDRSMSRKTGRGGSRPKVPLHGGQS